MTNVLLGRVDPPIDVGVGTLAEVANAYYSRAAEITMKMQQAEAEGLIMRGSRGYRFRTGPLRTFMEMAGKAYELGSRRITLEQIRVDQRLEEVP
jgi:hypothetical protein